ncbi:MAG: hypothetical protein VW771_11410, partial [Gammaproteobacteria bacterium]
PVMNRVQKAMVLGGVLASLLGVHGCSSSSSGVFGQSFNVMGHWSGTITDNHGVARAVTLTLVDSGEAVVGTINIVGYSCFSGGNFTGTPTPFPANTTGDNPLTADQENSNQGGITLSLEEVTSSGGVVGVEIVSGGTGYVEPPIVEFAAPPAGGRTATGVAVIGEGAVTTVVITDPGSGYAIPPAVTFSGGEGSDAIATGVLDVDQTTVYDAVTFNLVGSSSKLTGSYTGTWGSSSDCPVGTSGTISISRL